MVEHLHASDSQLGFNLDTKDEFHRWFIYTFLHVNTSHVTMNVLLQVNAPTFIFGGQKCNIIEIRISHRIRISVLLCLV